MQPQRKGAPDFLFLFLTFLLVCFGLVMIFSSSSMTTAYRFNDPWQFTRSQLVSFGIGIVGMIIAMNIRLDLLRKLVLPSFVVVLVLLIMTPIVAEELNGARSWIYIGGFGFQPTEVAKLGIILYLAQLITNKDEKFRSFSRGLAPALVIVGLVTGLIFIQNDLGSSIILLFCAGTVIFAGGAKLSHLFGVTSILAMLAALFISITFLSSGGNSTSGDHRANRILSFLEPDKYPQESYQVNQSLYAFGHGGVSGAGYGQGIQKLHYLPEAHNDFIFATIGEEFGFIGSILFLIIYLLFIWRGLLIAIRCKDKFGMLIGIGIMGMIGFQALINLGGVTQSIPLTGVTLPLISHGGTSLIVTLTSLGIVLGSSRSSNQISSVKEEGTRRLAT